jgi:hypothetical protein
MSRIEEIEQKYFIGTRFATKIEFHGGKLECGDGLITISSVLKSEYGEYISGSDKNHTMLISELAKLNPQLFLIVDTSIRSMCEIMWDYSI